jgi:hypothetical protein
MESHRGKIFIHTARLQREFAGAMQWGGFATEPAAEAACAGAAALLARARAGGGEGGAGRAGSATDSVMLAPRMAKRATGEKLGEAGRRARKFGEAARRASGAVPLRRQLRATAGVTRAGGAGP